MEDVDKIKILEKAIQSLIKPCPCCGGKDVYHRIDDKSEFVGCYTCGLNMQRVHGCNIIAQWNKRHIGF